MKLTGLKVLIKNLGKLKNVKSWIFPDGKFSLERTIVLLVALAILLFASAILSPEQLTLAVELLDEVSDIIGYAE